MKDTYRSIQERSYSLYKVNGSKFIGYGFAVSTEEEVKSCLEEVHQEHPQARHCCYAYALGLKRERYRMNDDGEPSGTAGKPIYGQILSSNLTNVLLVIVRYSNGTKLGVGGLISAYRSAAQETICEAVVVEKTSNHLFKITFEYNAMNEVMSILKKHQIKAFDQVFEIKCSLKFEVRKKECDNIKQKLLAIDSVTIESPL